MGFHFYLLSIDHKISYAIRFSPMDRDMVAEKINYVNNKEFKVINSINKLFFS
jgi:hypothetical protein